ncbi:hypothetical protein [Paenibacillus taihuensis]|nr:hypothetical protein [Paenibacillus taihuensis]
MYGASRIVMPVYYQDEAYIREAIQSIQLMDPNIASAISYFNGEVTSSKSVQYLYQAMTVRSRMIAFVQGGL